MTEWGYGEVAALKALWEAVNASCPDACPHLFEPQRLVGGYFSTQLQLHTNVHKCCHLHREKKKIPGISSDASSVGQLWDWAQPSATANCSLIRVCVYFHQWDCQRLSPSPTFYNPNPLLLLTAQFISGFQLGGQIGRVVLSFAQIWSCNSAGVEFRAPWSQIIFIYIWLCFTKICTTFWQVSNFSLWSDTSVPGVITTLHLPKVQMLQYIHAFVPHIPSVKGIQSVTAISGTPLLFTSKTIVCFFFQNYYYFIFLQNANEMLLYTVIMHLNRVCIKLQCKVLSNKLNLMSL